MALDTLAGQAAHSAALVVRALLGPHYLASTGRTGEVIALFDSGLSVHDVVSRVLDGAEFTRLAGSRSNADFVRFVYENVVGAAVGPSGLAYDVGLLDRGQFTQSSLGVLAATVDVNAASVEIMGVVEDGLEFVTPA